MNDDDDHIIIGLRIAAYHGEVEFMQSLINTGVNVNNRDVNGITPLYLASQ